MKLKQIEKAVIFYENIKVFFLYIEKFWVPSQISSSFKGTKSAEMKTSEEKLQFQTNIVMLL